MQIKFQNLFVLKVFGIFRSIIYICPVFNQKILFISKLLLLKCLIILLSITAAAFA